MAKKNEMIEVEAALVDTQARKLLDRVGDYLTEKDWMFSTFEEKDCLSFNLRLRDGNVRVFVDTWGGGRVVTNPGLLDLAHFRAVTEKTSRCRCDCSHQLCEHFWKPRDGHE